MKHAREDYNRIQDPAGLIPEDEPVFLLRGQDMFAPSLVREWAQKVVQKSKEILDINQKTNMVNMATLAIHQALDMMNWQLEHKLKIPDYNPDVKESDHE